MNIYYLGPHHPIFETLVKYPPEGYNVVSDMNISEFSSASIKEYSDLSYISFKKITNRLYRILHFPRFLPIWHRESCDIIFTMNVLPLTIKPCIIGVETVGHLLGGVDIYDGLAASLLLRFLHKRCHRIVAISTASKESIINYIRLHKPSLLRNISQKIDVVYPAIDTSYVNKIACNKAIDMPIQLVHVNTRPFIRGLIEFLEASRIIGKNYDIGLRIKLTPRYTTKDVLLTIRKYMSQFKRLNIPVYITISNLKREDIFKYFYNQGDIFVLPTWMDSFGFVFLEAMSAGLPCIGTDLWAIPEIIDEGINGHLIRLPFKPYSVRLGQKYLATNDIIRKYYARIDKMRSEVIKMLVEKIEKLITNPREIETLGYNAKKVTHEGKFSVKEQKARLKAVFERVLRR